VIAFVQVVKVEKEPPYSGGFLGIKGITLLVLSVGIQPYFSIKERIEIYRFRFSSDSSLLGLIADSRA
jgi:hypothetical protein